MLGVWKIVAETTTYQIEKRVDKVRICLKKSDYLSGNDGPDPIETVSKGNPTSTILTANQQQTNVEGCISEVVSCPKYGHTNPFSYLAIPNDENVHEDEVRKTEKYKYFVL